MPENEEFGQAVGRYVADLHTGIDRRKARERENSATKILRVPGHGLQSPQDARMLVSWVQKTLLLIEDRSYQRAIALEHVLKGPQQRVGSCFCEQRQLAFQTRQDSRVCSQAGKVVQHPVGELLASLAAKVDLRRYTPHGEQEEGRRQPIPQPFTVACRVRTCESHDRIGVELGFELTEDFQHRLPQQRDVLGADESTRAHEGVHRRADSPDRPDEVERRIRVAEKCAQIPFDL